jgi:hypothetical protein
VRRTLIVGKKLVTFNHLRKMRNLTVVRLRLYINIGKDPHTGGHWQLQRQRQRRPGAHHPLSSHAGPGKAPDV